MTARRVCAVIVTYHPDAEMVENLSGIRRQVDGLVVVDNGSTPEALHWLRDARDTIGFHLIENGENLGIAEALNQGVGWALSEGYPWVILFDQDSKLPEQFVDKMFEAWACHPQRERVASMHPRYVHPVSGLEGKVLRAKDGGPVKSLTSGALMPIWIFERIGFFNSAYFIDEVDSEYCFRIRAAGYLIADARQAILLHAVGRPERASFLGFTFRPTHHTATRRYYMSRNRLVVYRKYCLVFPGWILYSMYESCRETVKCFLGEKGRALKLRSFLLGTWDGLIGRMGKRENL